MEDWLASLKSGSDIKNVLSGQHTWHATSHARPTYCNVCREQLSGVTSHGLNCEICKHKVHKRCAVKAINNCKWTTLSSVGKEIIEDRQGNILMPHQWMEGNLPVSAKCAVCEKTCGSVLRLQDWRCLWCRATVHTACRPKHSTVCPLGSNRISVVPPTAIHSIGVDEAWEAVRPQGCSPLLVFVNSKSGDNQGVKFLKRFRQILNPAQVFDLITNGPGLGLRLFRHFDPFRVLICSGDGSVGWVLSEIDRLNMQLQCEIGVLPLGTGNDLARVLGWGASCDDDSQVPQLLERYERASRKILDRWSVMVFERSLNVGDGGQITINTTALVENNNLVTTAVAYEDSVLSHITKILQSDKHSVVIASAKILCETVKDFSTKISEVSLIQGDTDFSEKCQQLKLKLDHLLQTLNEEQQHVHSELRQQETVESSADRLRNGEEKHAYESQVKENKRPKKEQLLLRVNSLKKAVRNIVEHTERAVDEQNLQSHTSGFLYPSSPGSRSATSSRSATTVKEMTLGDKLSPCSAASHVPNVESISPLPDIRRDSTFSGDVCLESLPVPFQFADSRHGSFADTGDKEMSVLAALDSTVTNGDFKSTYHQYANVNYTEAWLNHTKPNKSEENKTVIGGDFHHDHRDGKGNVFFGDYFDSGDLEDDEDYDDNVLLLEKEEQTSVSFKVSEELLAKIGHIDSSETSDESPESSSTAVKKKASAEEVQALPVVSAAAAAAPGNGGKRLSTVSGESYSARVTNRPSLHDSVKDSEPGSYPISIDGMCNIGGSELDLTNLFSTSPEDDECSEEYRREMGLALSTAKRCSIAHFIEGSDIARKSIKCRHRKKSVEELDMECVAVNNATQSAADDIVVVVVKDSADDPSSAAGIVAVEIPSIEVSLPDNNHHHHNNNNNGVGGSTSSNLEFRSQKDLINIRIRGSHNNLALSVDGIHLSSSDDKSNESHSPMRISCALSETDDEEYLRFKALTRSGTIANSSSTGPTVIIDPPSPPATDSAIADEQDDVMNVEEKPSQEHLSRRLSAASPLALHCSPSPSRRISNISLLQSETTDSIKESPVSKKLQKALPIINPLVRLPQWPDISEPGIIGKVLLANADALCAAAVPLIDPDEILMEGFFERCVMNNYFGIGIDAKISLDFHHKREEHPEKCRSRTRNYMWYGVLGSKQWLQKTYKNLEQRVQLECDGHRIPLPSLQGIVILNIPSFMGGINFWGGTKEDDIFLAPSIDDRILEVVAVFGTVQMAASRLINLQHHRIAQCTTVQINIMGEEGVPIQVDGEAWIQPPGMIRIIHKNRMRMLCRNKSLENSLKTWEEKQKQLRQQSRLHSTVIGKLNLFTDEEYSLLLGFIEATAALIKSVKLLIIRHPKIEADLYELAATAGVNMEKVHPSGKILPAVVLRPAVTELVIGAQKLYEETCLLLRDKNLQIEPEIENQLNSTMTQMELELKKCTFIEAAPDHTVVYLRLPSPDDQEKKPGHRKGSAFWQKFRRGSGLSSTKYSKKDVALWGVIEVGSWLESLQLSDYVEAFASHDVRGRELLTLTRRDLKELGVTKVGHVKRILLALKDLAP